uniref:G_PROTEIN_RECEP_F1_2 domain-containing protein n=1 Tax=Caenorhabditis tropicalis TaxID=1561998 RepID=A0A1I7V3I2_9PELO
MFRFCTMLNSLTQAALVMERMYATRNINTYEYAGPKLGYYLASTCVIASISIVTYVTYPEISNEPVTNCFAFSSTTIGDRVYHMFAVQLFLAIITIIAYKRHLKYLKEVHQEYDGHLSQRYQSLQTNLVLKYQGRLIYISSALISLYIGFSSTGYLIRPNFTLQHYKQFAAVIFIMPHLSFFSMLQYYYIFYWALDAKKKRMTDTMYSPLNNRKDYMTRLREHWTIDYKCLESGSASPRSVKIGFGLTDY